VKKLRAQPVVKRVAPSKSSRKLQASGSIRRLNSLAANRVFQTEAYCLRAISTGPRIPAAVKPMKFYSESRRPRASRFSLAAQRRLSPRSLQTEPQSLCDSRFNPAATRAVKPSQLLNCTGISQSFPVQPGVTFAVRRQRLPSRIAKSLNFPVPLSATLVFNFRDL
jgi:hypothetical protein